MKFKFLKSKLFYFILLIVLLVLILNYGHLNLLKVNAEEKLSENGYYSYILHEDGITCTLTKISNVGMDSGTFRQIPSTVDGYTVTSIGDGTTCIYGSNMPLNDCKGQVIIPSTVTRVEAYSFYYLYTAYIYMPDTVTYIGDYAFAYVMKNNSYSYSYGRLSQNISYVGAYAFYDSDIDVATLDFTKLKSCGAYAFRYCYGDNVTEVNLSSYEGEIPEGAFSYNSNGFKKFILGNGVTGIGKAAFKYVNSLTSITFNNELETIANDSFSNCTALTTVNCPSNLKTIGSNAFYYCSSLKSISLNSGLTQIGENAFASSPLQAKIVIPKSVTLIQLAAFLSCSNVKQIYIYNPSCHIQGDYQTLLGNNKSTTNLYGYSGSTMEDYAKSNSFTFVSLNSVVNSITANYLGGTVIQGQEFQKRDVIVTASWVETNTTTTLDIPGTDSGISYSNNLINYVGNNNITVTYGGKSTVINIIGTSTTSDLDTAYDTISKLEDQIISLQNQLTQITADLQIAQKNIQTLTDSNSDLTSQLTEANKKITQLEKAKEELQNQLDVANVNLSYTLSTITNLQNNALNDANTIENLTVKVNELQNTISGLQKVITGLNADIDDLNGLIDTVKSELGITSNKEIISAIRDLKSALEAKNEENESLKNNIAFLEENLNTEISKNHSLNYLLNTLSDTVDVNNYDELNSKISDILTELEQSNKTIQTLTNEKNQLILNVNELIIRNTELVDQINKLEQLLKNNEFNYNQQINKLKDDIANLTLDKNSLDSSINKLNSDIDSLKITNNSLQDQINKLQSLLDNANLTIDELRTQLSESSSNNQTLLNENNTLREQIQYLNDLTVKDLLKQISELNVYNQSILSENESLKKQISKMNSEIDTLRNELNNSPQLPTTSTNTTVMSDDKNKVVLQVPETITNIVESNNNEEASVSTIKALDGWELSNQAAGSNWTDCLLIDETALTGIYTFFNNIDDKKVNAFNTIINKHTFYARKKSNLAVVYVCCYDLLEDKSITNEIKTTLSCNYKDIVLNYTNNNTYNVSVSRDVIFKVNADFGKYTEQGIYYQVVNKNVDFDPDGNWIKVTNNKIRLSNIKDACRVYIKYIDSKGNFVVDKTVGFKPNNSIVVTDNNVKQSFPIFEMKKNIYKGSNFNLNLANITPNMKIELKSSNTKIAIVNQDGIITSVNSGNCKITGCITGSTLSYNFVIDVKVVDGKGQKNLLQKKIVKVPSTNNPVLIFYKLIKKGKKVDFEIKNLNDDAIITYESSNPKVVSISKKGKIKGLKKGYSNVSINVNQDNENYIFIIQVRVMDGTEDYEMWNYLKKQ